MLNSKDKTVTSIKEEFECEMEDWVEALINSGYIMNFICNEQSNSLTQSMKKELFQSLKITG